MPPRTSSRRTAGLFLLSAGALCFEVALLRLYAIQQFYHFAFLVVSLAVLGTAAGGTALALARRGPRPVTLALAFTLTVGLAYIVLLTLPFDSYAIAWDRRQALILLLYFGSAALPFLCAGWFTGAALAEAGPAPGPTYAASLIGSAAGPLLALFMTSAGRAESSILAAAATGVGSAALLLESRSARQAAALAAIAIGVIAVRPPEILDLPLSPNKPLAQAASYPGAEVLPLAEDLSARLDVVEQAGVHVFPGLSLSYTESLPEQIGLYLDGDGPLAATSLDPDSPSARDLVLAMPLGIACELRPAGRVLLLRPGGGLDAALSLGCGAASVAIPTDQPLVAEALLGSYRSFTRDLLLHPRLERLPLSSRSAVEQKGSVYDVIRVSLSDPFRPVASGAYSLTQTDDLTLEAFAAALRRLGGDGLLVVDRWLTTPPADSLRAWATVLAALDQADLDPAQRLIAFRSLRTSTVVASIRPWTPSQLDRVRAFLVRNRFDPIYLPDLRPEELNRFNQIPDDPYPNLFHRLLTAPEAVVGEFPFRIAPATDDRPFFFHFFRWSQTREAVAALGRTWQPFGGSGYLMLLAMLVLVAILAGGLLAVAAISKRSRGRLTGRGWCYFAAIGAGFLLIELAFLQRLALPLERPTTSFIVVVVTLLTASGIGSYISRGWPARRMLLALTLLTFGLVVVLPPAISRSLAWPYPERMATMVALLVPLGLLMGVPFPAGLRRFTAGDRTATGVAWAVNGAASGLAGVLSSIIMLDFGISAVLALGGLAYLGAWLAMGR